MAGRKVFVGGIPSGISEDELRSHFDKYGAIADVVVMRERGFGFITFEDAAAVEMAVADQHVIRGQSVNVKEAVAKGGGGGGRGGDAGSRAPGSTVKTDKVFVGGLPQDCSDDQIRAYFERYGSIVDAVVMKDRESGRSRGFGFVQFDSPDPVEKVMAEYADHKIEGKWVEVKRSVPRDQMGSPAPRGGRDSGRSDDRPPPMGPYGGYAPYGGAYGAYGAPPAYGAYGGYGPPPAAYGYGGGYPYGAGYGMPPPAYGGGAYGAYPGYGQAPPDSRGADRRRSEPY